MLTCWAEVPDNRPEFAQIVGKLEPDHQKMIYVDFNELRHDYVFPPIVDLTHYKLDDGISAASSTATDSMSRR